MGSGQLEFVPASGAGAIGASTTLAWTDPN
jgi:hypothetical protein